MNTKTYIESGILEAYALGGLSAEEEREVEEVVSRYPDVKEELDRIEEGLEQLAQQTAITPPARLRQQVLDHFETKHQPERERKPINSGKNDAKVVQLLPWKVATAAASFLFIFSTALLGYYYSKWRNTENTLAQLEQRNNQIASDYTRITEELDELKTTVQVIGSPAYTRVALTGTDNAPDARASVYWNESSQEVFLNINQLADLAEGKQYQLWALVDGKPVDLGVFDPASQLLSMKQAGNAAAFCVTVEPAGGSENPTMETLQVYGETGKG